MMPSGWMPMSTDLSGWFGHCLKALQHFASTAHMGQRHAPHFFSAAYWPHACASDLCSGSPATTSETVIRFSSGAALF